MLGSTGASGSFACCLSSKVALLPECSVDRIVCSQNFTVTANCLLGFNPFKGVCMKDGFKIMKLVNLEIVFESTHWQLFSLCQ